MKTIEKDTVVDWLKVIGCTPNNVADPDVAWHLEFDYPAKTSHRMHAVQPGGQAHQIVLATGLNVSAEHTKKFDALPADEQREFAVGIRRVLTRPEVDFQLEGANAPFECPNTIQLSRSRYADGLTLDSFAETLGYVFKAKLHAMLFFQDRLSDSDLGNGGKFDFRRAGL